MPNIFKPPDHGDLSQTVERVVLLKRFKPTWYIASHSPWRRLVAGFVLYCWVYARDHNIVCGKNKQE